MISEGNPLENREKFRFIFKSDTVGLQKFARHLWGHAVDEGIARTIRSIQSLADLAQFERNANKRQALSDEIRDAVRARSAELGRALVAQKTGLDLSNLSVAEEKIVQAASEYAGIMKRLGKNSQRTFNQLRNRGLIGAAEVSVMKSKPTQGFTTLADADRSDLSYEKIIVDHPEKFSARALWFARRALGMPNESDQPHALTANEKGSTTTVSNPAVRETGTKSKRNPAWTREELILALDLYLRSRGSPWSKDSEEIDELSRFLARMAETRGAADAATFRNANGVYMKLMNFRRFDPQYTAEGKVGLVRGNKLEEGIWSEFGTDPAKLAEAVAAVRAGVVERHVEAPYWVFVCNPKKWAIDRFLDRDVERDTWGVRPSDQKQFAPGQLGIVRVGVDRRTAKERKGNPPLKPGIYAVCEVESEAFGGKGANDEFWSDGEGREPGWPTVNIRYIRKYRHRPLTIERLRAERPDVSPLLLSGFQGASFPIPASDFHAVMELLQEDIDELVAASQESDESSEMLATLEKKYIHASPEVKERVSRYIERGTVGALVKKTLGFKCQVCDALGREPFGFFKKNGEPYVEAHHVMPVSTREVGALAASNIMVLCANHHRQMHYGGIEVVIGETTFDFVLEERALRIPRCRVKLDAE